MEMIIKDIIVNRKYYYRMCSKVSDRKPNYGKYVVLVPELSL